MRPSSIVMFERLFLGSLVLSTISYLLSYRAMTATLERDPATAAFGLGGGFVVGIFVVGTAISLLLWYLIARKAVNAAKWVLVVLLALSLVSLLTSLTRGVSFDLPSLVGLAVYVLEVAAVVYLFRPDATAWLKGERNADATTFD